MIKNIWYVVTKDSNDGTFMKGDKIKLLDNGNILCYSLGWIDKNSVKEAIIGMEYEVDKEWLEKEKKETTEYLEMLKEYLEMLNNL